VPCCEAVIPLCERSLLGVMQGDFMCGLKRSSLRRFWTSGVCHTAW
jgi:hypothetical protein